MAKEKPIGVTMDWAGNPTLCFEGGLIYSKRDEQALYPEYYPGGCEWPVDPKTGEQLPIADDRMDPGEYQDPTWLLWATAVALIVMTIIFYWYG